MTFLAIPSASQDNTSLDDAVRQFSERVSSIPNLHGPVRLEFFQDASFGTDPGKEWQNNFRKEIERRHISPTDDPSAGLLRVGLAETPTQLVLSLAVRLTDKDEVRFLTIPRGTLQAGRPLPSPVRIERQLMAQSLDRILDAAILQSDAETGVLLLAYRNTELLILRFDVAGGLTEIIPLPGAEALPSRDPRGELAVHGSEISVFLPGKSCQFVLSEPSALKCLATKASWRGHIVLIPSCDPAGWKLLTDGGDWTSPDLLQAVPRSESRKGLAPLLSDFPGPILSINGGQDPASALVVTRNLQTGNYEVYHLTLACGN